MKLETLLAEKRAARKMDYHPSTQFTHSVIDSHVEALTLIAADQTSGNQVRHALADLRTVVERLAQTAEDSMHPEYGHQALYTLDMVDLMLAAQRPMERRWAYYQPRIEEEFGG